MTKVAYLFGYNPDLQITHRRIDVWAHRMQDEFDDTGKVSCSKTEGWTCANSHVEVGDEAFLFRHGRYLERGIIGHGFVVWPLIERPSFTSGKPYRGAPIEWDALKMHGAPLIGMTALRRIDGPWSSQASGIQIKPAATKALRAIWRNRS